MIHINDLTLSTFVEGMAQQGYKPNPEMMFSRMGGIKVYDHTGKIKPQCTRDYTQELSKAWTQALQLLTAKDIKTDLPILSRPFQASIHHTDTNRIGIWFDKDALYVSAWVVDLGSLEYALKDDALKKFQFSVPGIMGNGTNYLTIKYKTVSPSYASIDQTDMSIASRREAGTTSMYIQDSSVSTEAEFKTALQGVYLLYELAEPITIPFDAPLNVTLSDISDDDIIVLTDTEGNDMFEIESIAKGSAKWNDLLTKSQDLQIASEANPDLQHLVLAHPNHQWEQQNGQLSVGTILANLLGFGFQLNGEKLIEMWRDIQTLKAKVGM